MVAGWASPLRPCNRYSPYLATFPFSVTSLCYSYFTLIVEEMVKLSVELCIDRVLELNNLHSNFTLLMNMALFSKFINVYAEHRVYQLWLWLHVFFKGRRHHINLVIRLYLQSCSVLILYVHSYAVYSWFMSYAQHAF